MKRHCLLAGLSIVLLSLTGCNSPGSTQASPTSKTAAEATTQGASRMETADQHKQEWLDAIKKDIQKADATRKGPAQLFDLAAPLWEPQIGSQDKQIMFHNEVKAPEKLGDYVMEFRCFGDGKVVATMTLGIKGFTSETHACDTNEVTFFDVPVRHDNKADQQLEVNMIPFGNSYVVGGFRLLPKK